MVFLKNSFRRTISIGNLKQSNGLEQSNGVVDIGCFQKKNEIKRAKIDRILSKVKVRSFSFFSLRSIQPPCQIVDMLVLSLSHKFKESGQWANSSSEETRRQRGQPRT